MNIFKYIGITVFFSGLALFVYGTGGFLQMVPTEPDKLVPSGFELSLIISIVVGILTIIAMMLMFHRIDMGGLVLMTFGTLFGILISITALNVLLDTSKPVTRTILVNNIDIKPAARNSRESYYALVQSWWDYTQFLPVAIPKSIYDKITPRATWLDITVGEGAFGMPYYIDVSISDKTGPAPGLIDFNE